MRRRRIGGVRAIGAALALACASAPPDPLDAALRDGEAALAEGAGARAVAAYGQAVEIGPNDSRAHRGLLAAQLATGDGEGALRSLEWLAARDPAGVDVCPPLTLAVESRLARGSPDAAEAPARRALKAECPGMAHQLADVLSGQAAASVQSGGTARAIDLYREAIRLDPSEPQRFVRAGDLLLADGRHGEAVSLLARGLEAHPDDLALRDLMVRALTTR